MNKVEFWLVWKREIFSVSNRFKILDVFSFESWIELWQPTSKFNQQLRFRPKAEPCERMFVPYFFSLSILFSLHFVPFFLHHFFQCVLIEVPIQICAILDPVYLNYEYWILATNGPKCSVKLPLKPVNMRWIAAYSILKRRHCEWPTERERLFWGTI